MRLVIVWLAIFSIGADAVRDEVTRGTVQGTVTVSSSTVSLSGTLRVTLHMEGLSPLRMEFPKNPLHAEVAPFWRLRETGKPITQSTGPDRERITRVFELSPYRVGEKVPFRLADIEVRDGTAVEQKRLDWGKEIFIRVETQVTDPTIQSLRSPSSIESLPVEPISESQSIPIWPWALGAILLGLLVYWRPRRRVPKLDLDSKAWTLRELEILRNRALRPQEWCERFSTLLRRFIEKHRSIPATRLTSEEIVQSLPDLSSDHRRGMAERLQLIDQIRFSSAELHATLPFDPHDWISWCQNLLTTLTPVENLTESREVGQDTGPK